ncbi:MAG: hypothetical protein A2Y64_08150 [Candidatus Coatesbacteria bacterium RBG_13_66_14]|uniref:7(1) septoil knot domain-containing protein n=1 Tax=Candidatus Coatesbacteria bacterium RBG_13_66_14 TaxID=1817816 RepID=A0A1F5F5N4_9BACT|nr:MAG: hypothetical protein A2Y64_08150 [Candidatus Coatesbacteria bacterium RBG_13_66_14]
MKKLFAVLALVVAAPALASFVYICNEYEADFSDLDIYECDAYSVDYADEVIYLTDDPELAVDDDEVWYFVDDPDYADFYVYFTDEPDLADVWIYFDYLDY